MMKTEWKIHNFWGWGVKQRGIPRKTWKEFVERRW